MLRLLKENATVQVAYTTDICGSQFWRLEIPQLRYAESDFFKVWLVFLSCRRLHLTKYLCGFFVHKEGTCVSSFCFINLI